MRVPRSAIVIIIALRSLASVPRTTKTSDIPLSRILNCVVECTQRSTSAFEPLNVTAFGSWPPTPAILRFVDTLRHPVLLRMTP